MNNTLKRQFNSKAAKQQNNDKPVFQKIWLCIWIILPIK